MKRIRGLFVCGTAAVLLCVFGGSVVSASILEDVPFGDAIGTAVEDTANVVTGNQFDDDADSAGVVTNGSGQLDTSAKSNDDFGSHYIDTADLSTGAYYGVMELTWDFDSDTIDTTQNEEIRFSLIRDAPRSTFVTAEFEIQREDDDTVTILGNAVGPGGVDIAPQTINNTQTDNFIAIIGANLDSDQMALYFSDDDGATFTSITSGKLDPTRGIASLRMVINNDLSQDNVLIDRFYFTDMNPFPGKIPSIPEPSCVVLGMLGMLAAVGMRRRS